jgi:hypothetical protein
MPGKKTRLVWAQQAMYLAQAKELQAAGLDFEIPDEWQENSSNLDIIVFPPEYNILCELPNRVTRYAILMRVVALRSNLILEDFEIASEWDSESIALCGNARGLYRVGHAFQFTEEEALNCRIESGLHFRRRGDVAQGWLLASGLRPIPKKYPDRMITELRITFTDQFEHDYSVQAKASLQRRTCLRDSDPRVLKSQRPFEGVHPENEIRFRGSDSSTLKRQPDVNGGTQRQRSRQHDDRSMPLAWLPSVPSQ